jgi:hypothetical protein
MNPSLLITTVVQQTMVFIAQLATAGGVRAPLVTVADRVFLELTRELVAQGVKKKVIADMFGMGLRTYQRRLQSAAESNTVVGRTVWEAVFQYLKENEPVSSAAILRRFASDDPEIVTGILNDFVNSSIAYRTGRQESAVYRLASEADFADDEVRQESNLYLVWLSVFRNGPSTAPEVAAHTGLAAASVDTALTRLLEQLRIRAVSTEPAVRYCSDRFEVPTDSPHGFEAAMLDHFQAMITTLTLKLHPPEPALDKEAIGGSTWSFDVWAGHPLEAEAKTLLKRVRLMVEDLRARIDHFNQAAARPSQVDNVVVYLGQYIRPLEPFTEEQQP